MCTQGRWREQKVWSPDSHAVVDATEVLDLGAEHQVAKLGVGQEDDEEHDDEDDIVNQALISAGDY